MVTALHPIPTHTNKPHRCLAWSCHYTFIQCPAVEPSSPSKIQRDKDKMGAGKVSEFMCQSLAFPVSPLQCLSARHSIQPCQGLWACCQIPLWAPTSKDRPPAPPVTSSRECKANLYDHHMGNLGPRLKGKCSPHPQISGLIERPWHTSDIAKNEEGALAFRQYHLFWVQKYSFTFSQEVQVTFKSDTIWRNWLPK